LILAVAALSVSFTGPGAFSLDALLRLPLSGVRWGVAALAVSLAGGGIHLAQRRHVPSMSETEIPHSTR
jgi:hypothetical protein